MKEHRKTITYKIYQSSEELEKADKDLLQEARQVISKAYAPYSGYRVGAALLLENGKIFKANNQENVAFPSGMCAERIAIYYAHANEPGSKIKTIAIAAKADKFTIKNPISPCGACRQAITEYEIKQGTPIRIILSADENEIIMLEGIEQLLPFLFRAEELKNY